jgi:hypothetical protein
MPFELAPEMFDRVLAGDLRGEHHGRLAVSDATE